MKKNLIKILLIGIFASYSITENKIVTLSQRPSVIPLTKVATIHNIPIYGRINPQLIPTLKKIEQNMPKEVFSGVKAIYMTDKKYNSLDIYKTPMGQYISADSNNPQFEGSLIFNDGSEMNINLIFNEHPFIFIESGKFIDEYNFAFVLAHELGHHNGCHTEESAYAFAQKYISNQIFTQLQVLKYLE